jgi:hypothetical protein
MGGPPDWAAAAVMAGVRRKSRRFMPDDHSAFVVHPIGFSSARGYNLLTVQGEHSNDEVEV